MASKDAAPGLHHVVADLREQLVRYERASGDERDGFRFAITRDEARAAIEEFHRTSCEAERLLDACVATLFSPGLEKILVTVGACPALAQALPYRPHVRRSHLIGQHIPQEAYDDLLNTPDQRLSDAFQPDCPYCPHRGAHPVSHETILSYLRHVPEPLAMLRFRLDDHDGNVQGMQYRIARKRSAGCANNDPEVLGLLRCIEIEQVAKDHTERVLSEIAAQAQLPFVQVKTRVKGDGRLAQKIARMALDIGNGERIKDPYGVQCVVRTDSLERTRAFARGVQDALLALYPGSVSEGVRYDQSDNGAWRGYKMYAQYGTVELALPVAFQFLPLSTYWRERSDHPFYEERQLREMAALRERGAPVDKLMGAVEKELARASQEWREAHSSTS